MSNQIDEIELLRASDNAVVLAEIYLGLDERHLRDHESSWRPPMLHAVRSAKAACTDAVGDLDVASFVAELARLRLEDFHWGTGDGSMRYSPPDPAVARSPSNAMDAWTRPHDR